MNGRICPRQVAIQTIGLGIDHLWWIAFARFIVDTLVEFATEELDAQNGKHQPKDQTDEQHIEDGRYGEHERIDDNLLRT